MIGRLIRQLPSPYPEDHVLHKGVRGFWKVHFQGFGEDHHGDRFFLRPLRLPPDAFYNTNRYAIVAKGEDAKPGRWLPHLEVVEQRARDLYWMRSMYVGERFSVRVQRLLNRTDRFYPKPELRFVVRGRRHELRLVLERPVDRRFASR